jgi:hypothetical protein
MELEQQLQQIMNEDEMSVDSETDNANLTTEASKKHKQ